MSKFYRNEEYLGYDDVALLPQYSEVATRAEVDVISGKLGVKPFMAANMASVINVEMAMQLAMYGCLPIFHRFQSNPNTVLDDLNALRKKGVGKVGISIGIELDKWLPLIGSATRIMGNDLVLCFDVAHAHSYRSLQSVKEYKMSFPHLTMIAGNVATETAVRDLVKAGANIVKVGISNGAVCTTRVETGHGVPQLTSLMDCARMAESMGAEVIADGGIKCGGDIAKAIAAGAHYVMMGKMFAQCRESNGSDGRGYTQYFGSASKLGERGNKHVEGEVAKLNIKYTAAELLTHLTQSLRSALSYSGCSSIEEFRNKALFIKVSSAGYREGLPHALLN